MDIIEKSMACLKDMFTNCLTKAGNMLSGSEMADRKKMLIDMEAIGNLHVDDACLLDLKARLGELGK